MTSIMRAVLVFIVIVEYVTAAEILEGCDYDTDYNIYYCKDVTHVFPNHYYEQGHLGCLNCNITKFTEKTFPFPNYLVSFNVSHSGIRTISKKAFSKLTSTQYIYLDHNDIRDIAEEAFSGAKQLYELHLENNQLKKLRPGFLNGLGANSVDLSLNQLEDIPENSFAGAVGILVLDLSRNKITKFNKKSFNGLVDLEVLSLRDNEICYIGLGVLSMLDKLKTLDLSNNKLSSFMLGTFSGLKSLNELNLANNTLQDYLQDGDFLLSLPSLSLLDISSNEISRLLATSLTENSPSLKLLKMGYNTFTCSTLKSLIRELRKDNIEIISTSDSYDVQNIFGIACTESEMFNLSYKQFYASVVKEASKLKKLC